MGPLLGGSWSGSDALIRKRDKVTWVLEEVAPFRVVACAGPCGDDFRQRLALFLESGDFFADINQHVSEEHQVGLAAYRSVSGNDDRFIGDFCDVFFGRLYLPVDAASGPVVDEGIIA